jgi:hypothetical protein
MVEPIAGENEEEEEDEGIIIWETVAVAGTEITCVELLDA